MEELRTKYVLLARAKKTSGMTKGGFIIYEGNLPRAMEAFSLLSNAYRVGIINRGAYNLEVVKQVVPKDLPYMVKESTLMCKLRGDLTVWFSGEVQSCPELNAKGVIGIT